LNKLRRRDGGGGVSGEGEATYALRKATRTNFNIKGRLDLVIFLK
jgi:hypothetical protein